MFAMLKQRSGKSQLRVLFISGTVEIWIQVLVILLQLYR